MDLNIASLLVLGFICHHRTLGSARELTSREKVTLEKFRSIVENELYQPFMRTDTYLLWWLEDQKFDLEAAAAKLTKALNWRKTNDIDNILSEKYPFIDNYIKYDMTVEDSLGGPVVLADFGRWDVRRVVLSGRTKELNRYILQIIERGMNASFKIHKTKQEVSQWVGLGNLQGFSLRKQGCLACIPMYLEIVSNYENYYIGSIRHLIGINVPKIFDGIGNLVRGAMSPATQKIFKLVGNDRKEWNYLDTIIPRDQLPSRFGGTKP